MTKLNPFFHSLPEVVCPEGLLPATLLRLEQARRAEHTYRHQRAVYGLLLSSVLWLVALTVSGTALIQSEFWTLFGLLFSDFAMVAAVSGDFLVGLLETLPVIPLALILAPIGLALWSAASWLATRAGESPGRLASVHV